MSDATSAPAPTGLSPTSRTTPTRAKDRAQQDRSALYDLLDSEMICHLGVVVDGTPRVMPTGYGRIGDVLYLHGSTGARSLLAAPAADVCVTVTRLDGIVLARSVFHHSVNYRSAIIFGTPRPVTEAAEKEAGLHAITERLSPGSWSAARPPNAKELAATAVLALSLTEASVKVRQGPPGDDADDYALDVWAGVLPVRQVFGEPQPDPRLRPGIPVPAHVRDRGQVQPAGSAAAGQGLDV